MPEPVKVMDTIKVEASNKKLAPPQVAAEILKKMKKEA